LVHFSSFGTLHQLESGKPCACLKFFDSRFHLIKTDPMITFTRT
jgi:hypothetical protein